MALGSITQIRITQTAATAAMIIHFVFDVFWPVAGTASAAKAVIAAAATLIAMSAAKTIATTLVQIPLFCIFTILSLCLFYSENLFDSFAELLAESGRMIFIFSAGGHICLELRLRAGRANDYAVAVGELVCENVGLG